MTGEETGSLLSGASDTDYAGGVYHGKIIFPSQYPFRQGNSTFPPIPFPFPPLPSHSSDGAHPHAVHSECPTSSTLFILQR